MLRRFFLFHVRGICNRPVTEVHPYAVYNGWCTNWRWHTGACQDDLA